MPEGSFASSICDAASNALRRRVNLLLNQFNVEITLINYISCGITEVCRAALPVAPITFRSGNIMQATVGQSSSSINDSY